MMLLFVNSPARTLVVIELGGGGGGGYSSASAHCVCVVVRTLCVSLCRCSFVCTSFDLLRMCYVL